MNTYRIAQTDLVVSRIAYGCMNLGLDHGLPAAERRSKAANAIRTAVDHGITLFDHADIYARGESEAVFGRILGEIPGLRAAIVLQSKCGIRLQDDPKPGYPGRYDFSHDHIISSVEGSLARLRTTHLDILLLHRPDPLVEPEEVARAFEELQRSGKVRYFGVSNHNVHQIELLRRYVNQPLVVNQLELNLLHSHLMNDGVVANQDENHYVGAGGILDYCRLKDILVQAWAPVAGGLLLDPPADALQRVRATAEVVARLAREHNTTREAIVLAWLLRHPARIQPIIGTTRPDRIAASSAADEITLSREEWFDLFVAARGAQMP